MPRSRTHTRRTVAHACLAFVALAFVALGAAATPMGALRPRARPLSDALATTARYDIDGVVDLAALKVANVHTKDVRITLTTHAHGKIRAAVMRDGSFVIRDAPSGTHALDALAVGLTFPPVRVRVYGDDDEENVPAGTIEAVYAEDASLALDTKPLRLVAVSRAEYFEPTARVTVRSLVMNPMFMLVWMSIFMAYVGPKILASIDPEELKAMQEELTRRSQPSSAASASASASASAPKR